LERCRREQGPVRKGGETPHADVGDRRRSFLRCRDEDRGRSHRDERPRGCHCQLRALDHGRAAAAGDRGDYRVLEEGAVSMDRLRCGRLLCVISLLAVSVLATAQDIQVKRRLTPKEIEALPSESAGAGTSGLAAVTTR